MKRKLKINKRKRNPSDLEILKKWIKNQSDRFILSGKNQEWIFENWEPGNTDRLKIEDEYFEKIYLDRDEDGNLILIYKEKKNLPYIIMQYDDYGNMTLGSDVDYWLFK